MVRDEPDNFTTIKPVAGVAFNWTGRNTVKGFLVNYLDSAFEPIGRGYIMNPSYFYSIQSENHRDWRELHGIHVEFAMPAIPALPPEQGAEIMRDRLDREFVFYRVPKPSTGHRLPAVVGHAQGCRLEQIHAGVLVLMKGVIRLGDPTTHQRSPARIPVRTSRAHDGAATYAFSSPARTASAAAAGCCRSTAG
jgi:hypothetical protein